MQICGIYAIKNAINGKIYIGQSMDIRKRFREHKHHLRLNSHDNSYLQRSWDKYSKESFTFKIVERCPENELNAREIYYIKKYKKTTELYNLKEGGLNGGFPSEETRRKISESNMGHVISQETKEKISVALMGKKISEKTKKKISDSLKGRTFSEETRQKLSEATKNRKGMKLSEEHKKKISMANKGRIVSNETRKKIGEANKGRPSWSKGMPHTEEHRKKISEANKGKIRTEETKKKLSEINKGKTHTEETKKKMSDSHKGKNIWSFGRKLSEEHKRNISKGLLRRKNDG